jgi:hypothetical protein
MSLCLRTRALLHRRRSELGDAERLRLEEHLTDCDECRAEVDRVASVRELVNQLPERSIGPRGYQRALAGAFARGHAVPRREPAAARRWLLPTAVAVAGAAALALWLTRGSASSEPTPLAAEPGAAKLVAGQLGHGDDVLAPGQQLPAVTPLQANQSAVVTWNDATVEVARGSLFAIQPDRVRLDRGELGLNVAPQPSGRTVRIQTLGFSVVVASSRFQVTTSEVQVSEGFVRIEAPDGSMLVDRLAAGGSWRLASASATPGTPRKGAFHQAGTDGVRQPSPEPTAAEPPTSAREPDRPPDARPDPAASLRLAADALAAGDVDAARRGARAALAAKPTRTQAAEAHTLLAECDQVAGKPAAAVAGYLRVADRYRDLPAGETALFTAARLQANRGAADATALLRRYLADYAQGRFRREAEDRLRAAAPGQQRGAPR